MAVAIDSRYHGERATSMTTYISRCQYFALCLSVYSISLYRKELSSRAAYATVGCPKFVICGYRPCYGFGELM